MAELHTSMPPRPHLKDAPGARLESGPPPPEALAREEQAPAKSRPRTDTPPSPYPKTVPGARLESGPPAQQAPAREKQAPARSRPLELVSRGKEQLRDLTGYGVDSVSGFAKADGGWHLSVTVVELHRIPAATDVLASYEVDLDEVGDIVSYHRGRRYFRDQVGDEA